jgi:hypothetical protein
VFEKTVLRRKYGLKREGVARGWRRLHKEELHNLYTSPSIFRVINSRRMRWAGNVACMGELRNVYSILDGQPEGEGQLGIPRRKL